MQFGEFGDPVHCTTSYTGMDVVDYKSNGTRKRVRSPLSTFDNVAGRLGYLDPKRGRWLLPRGYLVYVHLGRRRIGQDGALLKYHLLPI